MTSNTSGRCDRECKERRQGYTCELPPRPSIEKLTIHGIRHPHYPELGQLVWKTMPQSKVNFGTRRVPLQKNS